MENKQALFYDFPKERFWEIVDDAIKLAFNVRVDELNCSTSWSRQVTDKTVEEVIEILKADKKCHQVFIHRRYFENHLEIGGSTMSRQKNDITYYLWITVDIEHLQFFIDRYGVKVNDFYTQFI